MTAVPAFAVQVHSPESRHPVVHVRGEVDLATASELDDCLASVLARDPLDLTLDLSATEFMDCSGFSLIVRARTHHPDEFRVILRRPRPFLRRVLGLLDLDALLVFEE